jgi:hypothetical protein
MRNSRNRTIVTAIARENRNLTAILKEKTINSKKLVYLAIGLALVTTPLFGTPASAPSTDPAMLIIIIGRLRHGTITRSGDL